MKKESGKHLLAVLLGASFSFVIILLWQGLSYLEIISNKVTMLPVAVLLGAFLGLFAYFLTRGNKEKKEDYELEILLLVAEKTGDLEKSNKELEQFAYVASHDLQAPIRHISAHVGILKKKLGDKLSPEEQESMRFILEATERIKRLISDLLKLSRLGKTELEMEEIDSNQMAKDVVTMLEEEVQDANAKVKLTDLPVITADKTLFFQILQNLIQNAIKFREKDRDPSVEITCKGRKDAHVFSVKDNGIGLDQTKAEKIFQIFQQLHGKSEFEGTGIGLSLCKKIVELHGGKIWVEAQKGQGSQFFFTIPYRFIQKEEEKENEPKAS